MFGTQHGERVVDIDSRRPLVPPSSCEACEAERVVFPKVVSSSSSADRIPLEGTAKITSPDLTFSFESIFFFETIPTLKPAKSNLFFSYTPGISAVSPPISLHSDILHPLTIPLKIFLVLIKFNLPVAI